MNRLLLLACVICGLSDGSAIAEDYLLRVDAIGYVDHPRADPKPKDKVLHSIEVIARPNLPFHTKLQFGKETFLLRGQFEPTEDGGFKAAIESQHSIDKVAKVPNAVNQFVPVRGMTHINTLIGIKLGESTTLGGRMTKNHTVSGTAGEISVTSQIVYKLTLTKYQPSKN